MIDHLVSVLANRASVNEVPVVVLRRLLGHQGNPQQALCRLGDPPQDGPIGLRRERIRRLATKPPPDRQAGNGREH
jgi:hypothetical protein